MIKVRIDVHPFGFGAPRHLGTLHIVNDGSGTETRGNYDVRMFGANGHRLTQRDARVQNHPRKSKSVWVLIREAIEAAGF